MVPCMKRKDIVYLKRGSRFYKTEVVATYDHFPKAVRVSMGGEDIIVASNELITAGEREQLRINGEKAEALLEEPVNRLIAEWKKGIQQIKQLAAALGWNTAETWSRVSRCKRLGLIGNGQTEFKVVD